MAVPQLTGQSTRVAKVSGAHRARLERILQRRVLLAIQVLRDSIQMAPLARLIGEGRILEAIQRVPLDELFARRLRVEVLRLVQQSYQTAGDAAAEKLKARLVRKDVSFRTKVLNWGFDVLNPRGLAYLQQNGAARIQGITNETRDALRALLSQMYEAGVPPQQQAQRIKAYVGMTEPHAEAVENLRERLVDMGTGVDRAELLVTRKVRQLTELRALNIARTETIAALSAGRTESWKQAAEDGLVNRTEVSRVWSTAEDEQTCAVCEPMDGQESPGLDGTFTTGDGEEVADPPAHVNCRCATDLNV